MNASNVSAFNRIVDTKTGYSQKPKLGNLGKHTHTHTLTQMWFLVCALRAVAYSITHIIINNALVVCATGKQKWKFQGLQY